MSQCAFPVLKSEEHSYATPAKPRFTERASSRTSLYESQSIIEDITYRTSSTALMSKFHSRENSISNFTRIQNEKLASSLSKLEIDKIFLKNSIKTDAKKLLKGEVDYIKLINKLNKIISPNHSKRPILFHDSDPIDVIIDENQLQICKIYVKEKKTPMMVKIQRFKGKIITYVSSSDSEPGPNSFEKYFRSDFFEIRENSSIFKYDNVFLGIKALEDSVLKVSVSFGKITSLVELKRIKRQLTKVGIVNEELEEERPVVGNPVKNEKDFVMINKNVKLLNSCLNAPKLKEKGEVWKLKQRKVVEMKKLFFQRKLEKNKDFLNKRIIKLQQERVEKEKLDRKNEKIWVISQWLGLIFFIKSLEPISSAIRINRKKKMKRITWNLNAYKIQKIYRGFSDNIYIQDKLLIRSRDNLLLYHQSVFALIAKSEVSSKICNFISYMAHLQITSHKFNNFKFKLIKLQKGIRTYLSVKRTRMNTLIRIWEENCQFYLFRRSSKKKITRKRQTVRLVTIPNLKRNEILEEYYHECVIGYIRKLKEFMNSINFTSNSKVFASVVSTLFHINPPLFEYIPSNQRIEQLIEAGVMRK